MRSALFNGAILTAAAAAVHVFGTAAANPDVGSGPDLTASCRAAGWDMTDEISAFKTTAENVPAGASASGLPPLEVGVLYVVKLRPQSEVAYLQISGKKSLVEKPLGGLAAFKIANTGKYRITVDSPLWIDVVGPDGTLAPAAYTGWHECRLFRKSVEYSLQAGQSYVLQLSEATPELVRVAIEAVKR